jgi:hypothetical protein
MGICGILTKRNCLLQSALTAKNFGPGVLSGFGSGLESSLFEQEKVNPVIAKMLMIKISFLMDLLFVCLREKK